MCYSAPCFIKNDKFVTSVDVAIIGGGPGGYVAAIRGAQLGLKVCLIEKEHLGGVCLNWGCIPTKALLRSAEVHHLITHAADFGIEVTKAAPSLEKMVARSRAVSSQLSGGIAALLKKNKVTVLEGHGTLTKPGSVDVTQKDGSTKNISAKHIIIATGARARTLPGVDHQSPRIWTARHAMTPPFMPQNLLVIGSGAIGIEFASFYQTLGCKVTVVEMQNRILPNEDEEISKLAQKAFEKQGMTIHTSAALNGIQTTPDAVHAHIETADKKTLTASFDAAIVAIGIVGNTQELGLEKTKVKVEKNQIHTNEWCETAEKGIYAIGDVAGAPWLAHKASHEAIICVEKIAGVEGVHPLKRDAIPGCTYSMPQIASLGLTEAKAKESKKDIKVGRFPYRGNGKALAMGESEGLVKTIFDAQTGELLGAHLIGAEVTELIHSFCLAKTLEATEAEFMHTIFPHPTLSEMIHESTLDAYGRVIHY
jgi:dihydrolipoamide dehydrogenase